ncbi:galactokinase [Algoriphagus namhaensis]
MMKALLRAEFSQHFDETPSLYFAPGRINLIGEHTDYQDGFVFPAATKQGIYVAIAKNNSSQARLYSIDFQQEFAFDTSTFSPKKGHWANYVMGMVSQLKQAGWNPAGFDLVIGGTIPVGAGLSSSAALSVAVGLAITDLFEFKLDKKSLARYAQKSEHLFAGLQCGIMDPYASAFGVQNHALFLDCRKASHEAIPVHLGPCQLTLVNSKVKHSLADTAYNDRRAACEESVRILKKSFPEIQSLRDLSFEQLPTVQGQLPAALFPKAKHVISENHRVQLAVNALNADDLETFGQLLFQSHRSLSRDYEVSCQELDYLVEIAKDLPGVLGSRMMGGGFGGCTLNLVRSENLMDFEMQVGRAYAQRFGTQAEFIPVNLSAGAHSLL